VINHHSPRTARGRLERQAKATQGARNQPAHSNSKELQTVRVRSLSRRIFRGEGAAAI